MYNLIFAQNNYFHIIFNSALSGNKILQVIIFYPENGNYKPVVFYCGPSFNKSDVWLILYANKMKDCDLNRIFDTKNNFINIFVFLLWIWIRNISTYILTSF